MPQSPISESDLYTPTLEILSQAPGGFLTTTDLIQQLWDHFQPSGKDAEILKNRNDTHFSQKVRNIVSHQGSSNNLINRGLVEYISERNGIKITNLGHSCLQAR